MNPSQTPSTLDKFGTVSLWSEVYRWVNDCRDRVAAPSIKRCARTDSAVAECLRSAVEDALPKLKAGLPKLGVQPLDPLVIDRLELSQGQGPINMDLAFTDMHTSEILDGVKVKRAM